MPNLAPETFTRNPTTIDPDVLAALASVFHEDVLTPSAILGALADLVEEQAMLLENALRAHELFDRRELVTSTLLRIASMAHAVSKLANGMGEEEKAGA